MTVRVDESLAGDAERFYAALGSRDQLRFMSAVAGEWLGNDANP